MTDEELMAMVKAGDLQKASILFDRYHKHLYNFFVKITLDKELGHDLTQNVFLRMIRFKHTYRNEAKFKSWIFQIARNIYADHYRSDKILKSDYEEVDRIGQKVDAIDEQLAKDEQEKLLYVALYKLNYEQRELLLLSKFQKMKYDEIAAIYETSVGNIKTKVHRAIKKLKDNYLELEKI